LWEVFPRSAQNGTPFSPDFHNGRCLLAENGQWTRDSPRIGVKISQRKNASKKTVKKQNLPDSAFAWVTAMKTDFSDLRGERLP
jgi:hypothetical protein